jgi:hypothetical protein
MKEYPHGWQNFDMKSFGISEFQIGTKLTIAEFRSVFLNSSLPSTEGQSF